MALHTTASALKVDDRFTFTHKDDDRAPVWTVTSIVPAGALNSTDVFHVHATSDDTGTGGVVHDYVTPGEAVTIHGTDRADY